MRLTIFLSNDSDQHVTSHVNIVEGNFDFDLFLYRKFWIIFDLPPAEKIETNANDKIVSVKVVKTKSISIFK